MQHILFEMIHSTTYKELDGPGIEFPWGRRFLAPVRTDPGAHTPSYTNGTGSFPGVKRSGRDVDRSPRLALRLKK